ncbi:hypothetical protein D9756_006872 [Leucocoprinus leucothites]|uniref:Arsenite methyltransferase n=1 Tax=Leucocoprinus leucothites TaxID=201217 RepID=A0A8H5G240_9AGAR|nr:hypothetical protein D9756_006872 [Leucoagaricus leucothites]
MTTAQDITQLVDAVYSERARSGINPSSSGAASSAGYTTEQLSSVPEGANLGLGCGCPVPTAGLQKGEVVLDLGSGGGLDALLAADQVGPTGAVVGLDGSEDMIALARRNAKSKGLKPPHVAFARALLTEELPIESSAVDCVLSNCVLNLVPGEGKAAILKEIFRVLKPGGRIHLADVVAIREMPNNVKNDMSNYVNCISGAMPREEYQSLLEAAGFTEISLINLEKDLTACWPRPMQIEPQSSAGGNKSCCSAQQSDTGFSLDPNEFVSSYQISARRPREPAVPVSPTVLKNWWYAYPEVRSTPDAFTAEEVAAFIRDPTKTSKDFTVIDVRRNDHAGGHVRGSLQCPAQSFYDDAPGYFEKFKDSENVIFYCQSSNGRGPRCAGWYQDYLNSVGHTSSKAYVMAGGIKGWMSRFKGEEGLVDYD